MKNNRPLSISLAIKAHCRECCNGHNPRTHCVSVSCPLFPYKCGKKVMDIPEQIANTKNKILHENLHKNWEKWSKNHQFVDKSRLQAIKERCKDCAYEGQVKQCEFDDCPLYLFRFGKNQTLAKRVVRPERKTTLMNNLKKSESGQK